MNKKYWGNSCDPQVFQSLLQKKGRERTIGIIFTRNHERFLRIIMKTMYVSFNLNHSEVKGFIKELSEEVFAESMYLLVKKYGDVVEQNYQSSARILYKIVINQSRKHMGNYIAQQYRKRGRYTDYKIYINKVQRERYKYSNLTEEQIEKRRRSNRKRYWLIKQDKIKLSILNKRKRENAQRRKQDKVKGIFTDKRPRFDESNPTKYLRD